jgi:hypothetical protein
MEAPTESKEAPPPAEPPKEEAKVEAPTESKEAPPPAEAPKEETKEEAPTESKEAPPPAEPPKEEAKEEAPTESKEAPPPAETPKEEAKEEAPKESKEAPPPAEPPKEEAKEEAPTESKEAPPPVEPPKEEAKEEAKKESKEAPVPSEEVKEAPTAPAKSAWEEPPAESDAKTQPSQTTDTVQAPEEPPPQAVPEVVETVAGTKPLATPEPIEAPVQEEPKAAWDEIEDSPVAPARQQTVAAPVEAPPALLLQENDTAVTAGKEVRYNEEVVVEEIGNQTVLTPSRQLRRQPSNFSEMKEDLLEGLKATINGTVEASVKDALGELRQEMQRRGAQADELNLQMRKLTRTVSSIQAGLAAAGTSISTETEVQDLS